MKLNSILNHTSDNKLYPKSDKLVSNSDFIGIEVELEQMNINNPSFEKIWPTYFWNVIEEESIREGGELIFKEPLCGMNILAALDEYSDFLNKYKHVSGVLPVISERCSLHVHLDVRDCELETINNISILYVMFEKIMFQLLNPSRYKNNYCIGLGSTTFSKVLSDMRVPKDGEDPYSYVGYIQTYCDKYGAMNYLSVTHHGSLEFRSHPGSYNKEDILLWINILLSLKKFARKFEDKLIEPVYIKGLDAEMFTSEIFGKEAHRLIQTNFFNEHFQYGRSWALNTLLNTKLKENTRACLKNKKNSDIKLIDQYKEAQ